MSQVLFQAFKYILFMYFLNPYNHLLSKNSLSKISRPISSSYSAIWLSFHQEMGSGASLVAQWLRIRLPMQGTRVRALVQEDPTCRGATKPMRHNY